MSDDIVWDEPKEDILWDTPATKLKKDLLKPVKWLARGFAGALSGLAEGAAAFNNADRADIDAKGNIKAREAPGNALTEAVNRNLPIEKNEGFLEKGLRMTTEGIGGAAAFPIPGAGILRMGATGAGGGLGAFAGEQTGQALGFPNAGNLVGGMVGGALTGHIVGPKQSVAHQDIRREFKGKPQAFWDDAAAQRENFKDLSVKSATVADLLPAGNRGIGLVGRSANHAGGEDLANILAGREGDMKSLTTQFLDRITPQAKSPNDVANRTAKAANAVLANDKNNRRVGVANMLSGEVVHPFDVQQVHQMLLTEAKNASRAEVAAAYQYIADKLVDQSTGGLLTDAQQINLALKSAKSASKNPNAPIVAGKTTIPDMDMKQAINAAETAFEGVSPRMQQAMGDFKDYTQQVMDPRRQSPIGTLADRNPLIAGQGQAPKLDTILNGNSARDVTKTANLLNDPNSQFAFPGQPQPQPVNPLDIARAIASQKTVLGTNDLGKIMRGNPGSEMEGRWNALLQAGGADPAKVNAPLRASDQLQNTSPANMTLGERQMRAGQFLIRPFRALDMALTLRNEAAIQKEIGRLMKDPANLEQIQKIAMFNPAVRKALTVLGGINPTIQTGMAGQGQ